VSRTLYEFRCACGHRWDAYATMDGPKESDCPECGESGRRAFSSFASPESFGKFMWPQRTPTARLKARRDDEDRDIWKAKKAAGDTMHPAVKG
jgi:putative FmdB family regulatory protein